MGAHCPYSGAMYFYACFYGGASRALHLRRTAYMLIGVLEVSVLWYRFGTLLPRLLALAVPSSREYGLRLKASVRRDRDRCGVGR